MVFACIYIPDFMVQSVIRCEPGLGDRPLALLGGKPPLGSVVAASASASQMGINLGMTKSQVQEFGPIEIRHRSEAREKDAHAAVLDVAWSISPRVEDTCADSIVLDLEGLGSLFDGLESIAGELSRRVWSIGLNAQVAVSANVEAALHAARGFPGITVIPAGQERQTLSCLPIQVLSIDQETIEILERWGVNTLGDFANLPVLPLSERLGQRGVRLHQLASGVLTRSLALAAPNTRFEEEMELEDAVEELEPLSFFLGRLLDQVCARLMMRSLALCAVHLRFELEPDFEKDFRLRQEGAWKKPEVRVYEKVLNLPLPVRDSKLLLKLVRLQLQADPPSAPIMKIVLSADAAAFRTAQNGLFAPAAPDPEKLELTVARLVRLVGDKNVGSPSLVDTHRPGQFQTNRFASPEASAIRRSGKKDDKENSARQKPTGGFRAVRPPLPLHVEIREKEPARVYLRGRCGKVTQASGPWKTSGDWWQEDSWRHDEWDVALDFGNFAASEKFQSGSKDPLWPEQCVYRIYHDTKLQKWFLRGIYD